MAKGKAIVDFHDQPRTSSGSAAVIGKAPKYQPYVSIQNKEGLPVASISATQMNRLVDEWGRANKKAIWRPK